MMYWGSGMGGWGMVLMTVSGLLFWGLLIAGVVLLVRFTGRSGQPGAVTTGTPQQVLAVRFARGEIDEEQYSRRLRILRTSSDAPGSGGDSHRSGEPA